MEGGFALFFYEKRLDEVIVLAVLFSGSFSLRDDIIMYVRAIVGTPPEIVAIVLRSGG